MDFTFPCHKCLVGFMCNKQFDVLDEEILKGNYIEISTIGSDQREFLDVYTGNKFKGPKWRIPND
jgi:hypothetical protein